MSQSDPRERHRGLSHHTRTVLDLLLAPVEVAVPEGLEDIASYPGPQTSMGRDDPLFVAAAVAAGRRLAAMMPGA
jgi:hypothetical protein